MSSSLSLFDRFLLKFKIGSVPLRFPQYAYRYLSNDGKDYIGSPHGESVYYEESFDRVFISVWDMFFSVMMKDCCYGFDVFASVPVSSLNFKPLEGVDNLVEAEVILNSSVDIITLSGSVFASDDKSSYKELERVTLSSVEFLEWIRSSELNLFSLFDLFGYVSVKVPLSVFEKHMEVVPCPEVSVLKKIKVVGLDGVVLPGNDDDKGKLIRQFFIRNLLIKQNSVCFEVPAIFKRYYVDYLIFCFKDDIRVDNVYSD